MSKKPIQAIRKSIVWLLVLAMMAGIVLQDGVALTARAAGITVKDAAGYNEGAYIEWEPVEGADGYQVYVSKDNAAWTLIDDELIRKYPGYFRADALGLTAGTWYLKIEAAKFDANKNKGDTVAEEVREVTVVPHDRSGFAWVNGTSSGAYNEDGSLIANANVIYVTDATKDTVSLNVEGATTNPCVGLQNILLGYKKKKETKPLDVRIIGNITDFAVMDKGDLLLDGNGAGITIEGVGEDAVANGWGLRIKGVSNVEVRNLAFMNCDSDEGDNVSLQQDNDHVWVHHCDLFYGGPGGDSDQAKGDGALDIKKSDYATFSYNHFWDSGKSSLCGMKSCNTSLKVTYHHNWFDHSDSRHPRVRFYTTHVYNNYYDGNAKYGVGGALGGASIFVENNYFRNCPYPMLISQQGTDLSCGDGGGGIFSKETGSIIKAYGNEMTGVVALVPYSENNTDFDAYVAQSRDEQVPDTVKTKNGDFTYNNFDTSADFYKYTPDAAADVPAIVMAGAGRVNGGDITHTFTSADDTDSKVNQELKAKLLNYTSKLISVGGIQGSSVKVEYTVTFKPGNGDADFTVTVDAGQKVDMPDILDGESSHDGKKFGGWYNGTTKWDFSKPVTGNMTLTAKWLEEGETDPDPGPGGDDNVSEGAQIHDFTANGTVSTFYTITGNLATGKGTVTYDGKELTKCLKMESATKITFTAPADGTLTLVFGGSTSASGKKVKINGTNFTCDSNSILTQEVAKGAVEISKGDSINLFYMIYSPNSSGSGEGGGDNDVTEYTVTIDLADGSAATTLIVDAGKSITAQQLPTPTREGYVFIGWVDSNNMPVNLPYKPTANMTIKAVWEKEIVIDPDALYNMYLTSSDIPTGTYTSDFQKNGFTVKAGEGADQSVSVDVGSKKTIGGKDYTGRLKTGGIGTKDYRSIKFTTKDAATLTMACVVATTGDICTLGVATLNENGEFVEITEGITVDGKTANVITLSGSAGNLVTVNLPAADTYYIYSKGGSEGKSGGVNFYAINVTYANGVDPVFCTVTFNSMGGLSVESQKVQAGDACVEPAGTLKSGYTFDGWYADYECTKKYDFSAPVKNSFTLYAKWLAGEPAGEYLVLDMKDLPARDYGESFSRNGFTFKATSAKNLSVDASAVTVEDVDYTKRLKLNGTGSTSDRNLSFTIEASATLTLVAASGSSGTARALKVTNGTTTYDIAGIDGAAKYTQELTAGTWQIYAAKDGVNIYYISVKGEGVKAQYIITIDRQDGTEAVVKTVVEGTQLTETDLPSALTRDGYTFQGWVDEDGSAITVPYTPTQNMTIKAMWQKNNEDPKPGPGTGDGEDPKPGPGTGDGEDPKPGPGTGDGEDPKPGPGTGDGEDHIGLEIELAEPGEEYVYIGSAVKPEIIVTNNGELLTEGVDYTVKYSNNIKAADKTAKNAPKITVSGKGNLTGSTYTTFTIGQKNLEDEDVVKGDIVVAKGSKAAPVLVYKGVKLGTKDYEFAVKDDAKKKFTEDGTIVLNGKGNFTGSITLDVTAVDKADLKKFTVEVDKKVLTYNGDEQYPAITVKDSKSQEALDETKYHITYGGDKTSAGTQKFTVIGMNGYTGTVAKSYSIKPLAVTDPSAFAVEGVEESYTFRSAGVTLEDLKVYYGEEKELLTAGKDYKVTYSNNKKVSGKSGAKYTITFLGNYKGSKAVSGTFKITAAPLNNDTDGLKIVPVDKTYKKPGQYKSAPYVSIDGVLLKGSDYKVEYYLDEAMEIPMGGKNKVTVAEGADSATVYVKITGKGNYAPADENTYATMTYEVCKVGTNQADLSKARVTFVDQAGKKLTKAEYTGLEVEPAVKVEIKDGKNWKVVDDDQYEVTYVNNVNKGKATAVITAVGTDCVSSKTATFNIVARNLKNQTALWDNLFKMIGK